MGDWRSELTVGDWARYAGLLVLASLVFLIVYGNRDGALISLLAVYFVAGAGAAVWIRRKGERS